MKNPRILTACISDGSSIDGGGKLTLGCVALSAARAVATHWAREGEYGDHTAVVTVSLVDEHGEIVERFEVSCPAE